MKLYVELRGAGEAVVFLNGYPVRIEYLRPLGERLARERKSAIVHLPGYGESPALSPYDAERSHELVEDALLEHGIREATFVGYSFGLYRAIALALRGRVRARAIVGLAGVAGYEPAQAAQFRELAKILGPETDLAAILETVMLSESARQRPDRVAEVRSWAGATSVEDLRAEIFAMSSAPDLLPRVAELDVPLLLRVGGDDVGAPPARSRQIAAVAKRCTLEEVEGVGHTILSEDFEATARSIEAFLSTSR
jgi:pimeloyl-ACP methyl ester carboxylesterase